MVHYMPWEAEFTASGPHVLADSETSPDQWYMDLKGRARSYMDPANATHVVSSEAQTLLRRQQN